jgi:hypothetical protein
MDEARLIEKLRSIEALYAGATTDGEKMAADLARDRIRERLKQWEQEDPPIEYQFSMEDMWARKVFVALLRRYGVRPYRYKRQRYTTVMANLSKRFVDETLWPEYQEISKHLRSYLNDVTNRVVHDVLHQDSSEADVVAKPLQLALDLSQEQEPPTAPAPSPGVTPSATGTTSNTSSAANKRSKDKQSRKNKQKSKRRNRR